MANLPVSGTITQYYSASHKAVDVGCPVGSHVKTNFGGVYQAHNDNPTGYGNYVTVVNGNTKELFGHLSQYYTNLNGKTVKAGDLIGLSGNTGNSTGPHLHYEIIVNGVYQDPVNYGGKPSGTTTGTPASTTGTPASTTGTPLTTLKDLIKTHGKFSISYWIVIIAVVAITYSFIKVYKTNGG